MLKIASYPCLRGVKTVQLGMHCAMRKSHDGNRDGNRYGGRASQMLRCDSEFDKSEAATVPSDKGDCETILGKG
jgi:hypothetical protein